MALVGLILCFLVPTVCGTLLVLATRLVTERVAAVATGAAVGLAAFTTLSYGLSLLMPPSPALPLAGLGLLAAGALWLAFRSDAVQGWREAACDPVGLVVALAGAALMAPVAVKTLIAGPGGWSTGFLSTYGDVAFHAALTTSFASGPGFPPENPIFAGTVLSYPFLSDVFTSLLLDLGSGLVVAFDASAAVLVSLVLATYYCLARELTGSKRAAALAVGLFAFGGATLGFLRAAADFGTAGGIGQLLTHWPAYDYAGSGSDPDGFHFINPCVALLLAQRALLFGMPLAFTLVLAQVRWLSDLAPARRSAWLVAGAVAGMLPLFHPHTILALIPLEVAFFWQSLAAARARGQLPQALAAWGWFTAAACAIGLPEVAYYLRLGVVSGHLSAHAWWLAGSMSPLTYWAKNTGLLLPLAALALVLPGPRAAKLAALAGCCVFAAANTWQFARWSWDNYKLFVYWLLLTLPLVTYLLDRWLGGRVLLKIAAGVIVVGQCLAGGLDYLKAATADQEYGEWDPAGIALAARMRAELPPKPHVVIAPVHNSPVFLAGAVAYLGYPAHAWSHGFDPDVREQAVKAYYQGSLERLPDATPAYVLVGPAETAAFAPVKIRAAWRPLLTEGPYTLYALASDAPVP